MNNQLTFNILVTVAGIYLISRQRASDRLYAALVSINDFMEQYDAAHFDPGYCDQTILCTRTKYRHKINCLGKEN